MRVLVFDVGGTRLKAGLATHGGISSLTSVPTDAASLDALVGQMATVGRKLLRAKGPKAVGVSVKGIVDSDRGLLVEANPPFDLLRGAPLAERLPAPPATMRGSLRSSASPTPSPAVSFL